MNPKTKWSGLAAAALLLLGLSLTHAQTADQGTIVVKVPADAILTIDGAVTKQTGASRTFYSPSLEKGYKYQHQFTVTWMEGGKKMTATKWVDVSAGKTTSVDLTLPVVVAKKPDDKTKVDGKTKVDDKTKEPIKSAAPKLRTFDFVYSGVVKDLKPGVEASVWLPFPQNTESQEVTLVDQEIPGGVPPMIGQEKEYGNKMLFFKAKADAKGEIPFRVEYRVKRKEVLSVGKGTVKVLPAKESMTLVDRFLAPDKLVPLTGKPLELLKGTKVPTDPLAAAKIFYDVVDSHMKYDKPAGKPVLWGRGDSVWACDAKFGNCTDFHSVFISMARGNKIAAKFEMGFPIPDKRGSGDVGGYHCWAWFMGNKGWIPVDISEANRFPEMKEYYFGNLTENRVQFTTGRDINLVPPQKGPALNFFIYPYVEVDGMQYPNDKIARKYSYEDVK